MYSSGKVDEYLNNNILNSVCFQTPGFLKRAQKTNMLEPKYVIVLLRHIKHIGSILEY